MVSFVPSDRLVECVEGAGRGDPKEIHFFATSNGVLTTLHPTAPWPRRHSRRAARGPPRLSGASWRRGRRTNGLLPSGLVRIDRREKSPRPVGRWRIRTISAARSRRVCARARARNARNARKRNPSRAFQSNKEKKTRVHPLDFKRLCWVSALALLSFRAGLLSFRAGLLFFLRWPAWFPHWSAGFLRGLARNSPACLRSI